MTDANKICFISCVNDLGYEEEFMRFLGGLHVPEGYGIEQLSIWDAESMAAGYNQGQRTSNAKYKIYMHQDVFVIDKDFLYHLLEVFQADESVGMIGMVGSTGLPDDGVMWNGDRIGLIYSGEIIRTRGALWPGMERPYREVEAVDGLLMATQYDLPWREDLFKGWDFYDVSQSFEYRRKGYKVVVPYMEAPWVLHDTEWMNLEHYEKWRRVFLENYSLQR